MLEGLVKSLAEAVATPGIGYLAAFLAGLLSSLSPCAVAAIPLAVGYVGGYASGDRKRAVACSLSFIAGLTVTFTLLGALAGGMGFLFASPKWQVGLAAVITVLGLNVAGVIRIPLPTVSPNVARNSGLAGGFVLGAAIGTVSAPCATPALIAILALSSTSGNPWGGAALMAAYAVGHWATILVAGLAVGYLPSVLAKTGLAGAPSWLTRAMGMVIALVGAWMLFASVQRLI
ncbi:MAG: cytochrome c biogenesis protein CcdA [Firmicutes bacterium]|jgi:cytochrome c biogenesis protein CcdA|nr:cytochrome c biogenesis protein CcdA [Bacillota bacterium]